MEVRAQRKEKIPSFGLETVAIEIAPAQRVIDTDAFAGKPFHIRLFLLCIGKVQKRRTCRTCNTVRRKGRGVGGRPTSQVLRETAAFPLM